MRLTRLGCAALMLCAVATGFDASAGGLDAGQPDPSSTMISKAPPGYGALPVCKLGVFGAPDNTAPDNRKDVLTFDPVNGDYFYTWLNLDSLSCNSACGLGTVGHITAAHVAMSFPAAPETLVMAVSLVGVVQRTCRYQDPTVVFCPAFDQTLTWEGALNQNVDFAIPLTNCGLEITASGNGQSFLEYNFKYSKYSTQPTRPRLVLQTDPVPCTTFVPAAGFPQEDWFDNFSGGNPILYADVEQCVKVPGRVRTWGQLKQLYR